MRPYLLVAGMIVGLMGAYLALIPLLEQPTATIAETGAVTG